MKIRQVCSLVFFSVRADRYEEYNSHFSLHSVAFLNL